ncbi:putative oxidoreductase ucpA [Didymella exigua CBS 183.55]|uniref:Putative oxidoreductase ucpA n=1 Tax=Didymella exigua CBS 183.55 TaxID=1150837 RepID=A0A6A5RFQ4_9PLEO|nr:putative oxidoreductase ucpA [Didymella exigua CBS 183.55]KAF1927125.1 putative oxidoreductase ucpA [Didymella exigua CBS 183.55]
MAPLEKSPIPQDSGFDFVGLKNLRNDIYPAIDVSKSSGLQQPGKVVLITGAGRGIGRSMAIQYSYAKVSAIVICARTRSELDEVADRVKETSSAVTKVSDKFGRLDILINNAGLSRPREPVGETDPEDYWQVLEVNLHGSLLLTHAFLPLLLKTAERQSSHVNIINVTSIGAVTVSPGGSSYSLAKLALQKLSEFVGLEYSAKGVNVFGIHPGGVVTKLANEIKEIKHLLTDEPELCGGFVVWLSNQDRRWLNGRYVSATWDVETLESMREEIEEGDKLKVKMVV